MEWALSRTLGVYSHKFCATVAPAYFFQTGQIVNQRFYGVGAYIYFMAAYRVPSHTKDISFIFSFSMSCMGILSNGALLSTVCGEQSVLLATV